MGVLQGVRITRNADGRAGAGFEAKEKTFFAGVAADLATEELQAGFHAFRDTRREDFMKRRGGGSGEIAHGREIGGDFSAEKVFDALPWGFLAASTGLFGGNF